MSLYFSQVYDSFSTAMHPPLNIAELSFLCFVFGICRSPFAPAKPSGFISDPRSRQLAALRADSQLEKGRSPLGEAQVLQGPCPFPISGLHLREAPIHEQSRAPRLIG
jgi:hypothetical protein